MPRRQPPTPDTRLDWRDLNMPVLGKSGRPIPHEKMQLRAQMCVNNVSDEYPNWRKDPTYNLRKDRK
jgi:hypothetical protein